MPRLSEADPDLLGSIRGIVFDKDGTLADLEQRWVPFFSRIISTVADYGGDPEIEKTLASALGVAGGRFEPGSPAAVKSEGELAAIALGHLAERGWSEDDAAAALLAGVEAASFGSLVPLGDVAGAMTALSGRFELGVATSDNRDNTLSELVELGIADLVSAVHCGDDGNGVKPQPEVLWGITRSWSLEPGQVLFVGDSMQDHDTARAAGCRFIAVDPGPPEEPSAVAMAADAWVASVEELVAEF